MNNIPKGCKPFNYEEAIKDLSKVVTRDGRNVNELHLFHNGLIAGTVGHNPKYIHGWYSDGSYNESSVRNEDLFLKDETVVYVNVDEQFTSGAYLSLDHAISNRQAIDISVSMQTISNGEIIKTETVHKY